MQRASSTSASSVLPALPDLPRLDVTSGSYGSSGSSGSSGAPDAPGSPDLTSSSSFVDFKSAAPLTPPRTLSSSTGSEDTSVSVKLSSTPEANTRRRSLRNVPTPGSYNETILSGRRRPSSRNATLRKISDIKDKPTQGEYSIGKVLVSKSKDPRPPSQSKLQSAKCSDTTQRKSSSPSPATVTRSRVKRAIVSSKTTLGKLKWNLRNKNASLQAQRRKKSLRSWNAPKKSQIHIPGPTQKKACLAEEPALSTQQANAGAKKAQVEAEVKDLEQKVTKVSRKRYLSTGLYVGQDRYFNPHSRSQNRRQRQVQAKTSKKPERKILPMPMFAGERLLDQGRDFKLPFEIFSPLPSGQPKPNEWKRISKNVFSGESATLWKKEKLGGDRSTCCCDTTVGCDERCQNRLMFYECDDNNCDLPPESCGNRSFMDLKQRCKKGGKYSIGVEVIKTTNRGYGVRSNRSFEPNQIIVEYTGEIITQSECDRRMNTVYKHNECYYLMSFEQNMIIDATRGSIARFVNHSCEPNCRMEKWNVRGVPRMALFAGENGIMTGEELTYDYNFDPFCAKNVQECRCGAPTCRGFLGPTPSEAEKRNRVLMKRREEEKAATSSASRSATKRKYHHEVKEASQKSVKRRKIVFTMPKQVPKPSAASKIDTKKVSERALSASKMKPESRPSVSRLRTLRQSSTKAHMTLVKNSRLVRTSRKSNRLRLQHVHSSRLSSAAAIEQVQTDEAKPEFNTAEKKNDLTDKEVDELNMNHEAGASSHVKRRNSSMSSGTSKSVDVVDANAEHGIAEGADTNCKAHEVQLEGKQHDGEDNKNGDGTENHSGPQPQQIRQRGGFKLAATRVGCNIMRTVRGVALKM